MFCNEKRKYGKREAERALARVRKISSKRTRIYLCECGAYHLTTTHGGKDMSDRGERDVDVE